MKKRRGAPYRHPQTGKFVSKATYDLLIRRAKKRKRAPSQIRIHRLPVEAPRLGFTSTRHEFRLRTTRGEKPKRTPRGVSRFQAKIRKIREEQPTPPVAEAIRIKLTYVNKHGKRVSRWVPGDGDVYSKHPTDIDQVLTDLTQDFSYATEFDSDGAPVSFRSVSSGVISEVKYVQWRAIEEKRVPAQTPQAPKKPSKNRGIRHRNGK